MCQAGKKSKVKTGERGGRDKEYEWEPGSVNETLSFRVCTLSCGHCSVQRCAGASATLHCTLVSAAAFFFLLAVLLGDPFRFAGRARIPMAKLATVPWSGRRQT